jgi:hypothetical protein
MGTMFYVLQLSISLNWFTTSYYTQFLICDLAFVVAWGWIRAGGHAHDSVQRLCYLCCQLAQTPSPGKVIYAVLAISTFIFSLCHAIWRQTELIPERMLHHNSRNPKLWIVCFCLAYAGVHEASCYTLSEGWIAMVGGWDTSSGFLLSMWNRRLESNSSGRMSKLHNHR